MIFLGSEDMLDCESIFGKWEHFGKRALFLESKVICSEDILGKLGHFLKFNIF